MVVSLKKGDRDDELVGVDDSEEIAEDVRDVEVSVISDGVIEDVGVDAVEEVGLEGAGDEDKNGFAKVDDVDDEDFDSADIAPGDVEQLAVTVAVRVSIAVCVIVSEFISCSALTV